MLLKDLHIPFLMYLILVMLIPHILIIDDHDLYRSGLRAALNASMPAAVIYEAASIDEAMGITSDAPDTIVLDFKLPGLNGADGITLIKKKWPQAPVLMLSSQNDPETINTSLERGATGFVSKGESAEKIVAAINRLIHGQVDNSPTESTSLRHRLTPRQCEVLELLCQGMSNKMIAKKLSLSENTVRVHVQAVLGFLQVTSRSEAAFAARSRGLIS